MTTASNTFGVEQWIDGEVQRRLSVDSAYRNAEDAEQQSTREAEIVAEVECFARRMAVQS